MIPLPSSSKTGKTDGDQNTGLVAGVITEEHKGVFQILVLLYFLMLVVLNGLFLLLKFTNKLHTFFTQIFKKHCNF